MTTALRITETTGTAILHHPLVEVRRVSTPKIAVQLHVPLAALSELYVIGPLT